LYHGNPYYWRVYPPVGYYYGDLDDYETVNVGGEEYYEKDGVYYQEGEKDGEKGYVVAEDPAEKIEPQVLASGDPAALDPFDTLRKMSDQLVKLKQFSAGASVSSDEVLDSGQKVKLTSRRTLYVSRPNRLAAQTKADGLSKKVVYDGKTVTILNRTQNAYAVAKVPDKIESMLEKMVGTYGMNVPLVDFLYADPYAGLTAGVQTGQYMGLHTVGVYQCHHLAFSGKAVDWEVWVQSDDKQLPRKLVITYKQVPGKPRFEALISRWDLDPPSDYVFKMTLPSGAEKIDLMPVAVAKE
jgi:hypothetical protein